MGQEAWDAMVAWVIAGRWLDLLQALLILLLGLLLARLLGSGAVRLLRERLDAHSALMLWRAVFYLVLVLTVASALHQLGFKLGVLLGAAGVASVAIGFAAQTSISNLISGLFLMTERPFGIGDTIRVGATTGEVLSVDLLSVKLRTPDNLLVRIPNETLIKSELTNFARFPIRRVEVALRVGYGEDLGRVRRVLMGVVDGNPRCLQEPAPLVVLSEFGESAVGVQLLVWCERSAFLEVKNALMEAVRRAFDEAGIAVPYPQRGLVGGAAPLAVRMVDTDIS